MKTKEKRYKKKDKNFFCLLSFFFFVLSFPAFAQSRHLIKLRDKKNSSFSISQPAAFLSPEAIQRRARQNIRLDSTDLPVSKYYIDSLDQIPGVAIVNSSKWLNQVMVELTDPLALDKINACSFVLNSSKIAAIPAEKKQTVQLFQKVAERRYQKRISRQQATLETTGVATDTLSYGNSYAQIHIHEGEWLHQLGLRGSGMTIAVLDGGFSKYTTNPALDSVRMNGQVLAAYDFVKNETSVDEDNVHGANCFTIMAANRPGVIVGSAPSANYILFRTEDVATETPSEEENWIAGAERADSMGADIISSSLGYTDFDDPAFNHTYAQRDGNTAMITIAADMAVKKGILVVNAAGNSGAANNDSKFVMCPADGDSVLSVGAVNSSGIIAGFSSWGPNGAGNNKPSVVSMGAGASFANTLGNAGSGNGTSYAAPNLAGLIACLWQAFSDFTNMEIIDAVQRSANKYTQPDDRYGYGIPNFRIAYKILFDKRTERLNARLKSSWITVYPVPFRQQFTAYLKAPASGKANMRLLDISGRTLYTNSLDVIQDNYYTIDIRPPFLPAGVYYFHYNDGKTNKVLKLAAAQ